MNLFGAIFSIIQTLLSIYGYLLLATAIMSWIPDLSSTQLGQFLSRLTEPYLRLFRFIPPLQLGGVMLDISFIVAVVVYFFVQEGVLNILAMVLNNIAS